MQVKTTTELTGEQIQPGFSGAPAMLDSDESIIGMVAAYDDKDNKRQGFIIPNHILLDALGLSNYRCNNQINSIIYMSELFELKELIIETKILNNKIHLFFNQFLQSPMPNSLDLPSCLCHLAQMGHSSSNAPLFEFLEFIKYVIDIKLSTELTNWKDKVSKRLPINLQEVSSRVDEFNQKNQIYNAANSFILLKVEPKNLVNNEQFLLRVWLCQNSHYQPQDIGEENYTFQQLESSLGKILGAAIYQFGATTPNIEIVLPMALFHWNINHLEVQAGPKTRALGKLYAINLRSWDRIYHSNYDIVRPKWTDKWQQLPCAPQTIQNQHIHYFNIENTCCETLYDELEQTALIFMSLCALPWKTSRIDELFGTALAAGLPFVFWSPQPIVSEEIKPAIEPLLCSHDSKEWLAKIQEQKKKQPFLNDLMILWDSPERLPPDTDYQLTMPD